MSNTATISCELASRTLPRLETMAVALFVGLPQGGLRGRELRRKLESLDEYDLSQLADETFRALWDVAVDAGDLGWVSYDDALAEIIA